MSETGPNEQEELELENGHQLRFVWMALAVIVALAIMGLMGYMMHVAGSQNAAAIEEIRRHDTQVLGAIQKRLTLLDHKLSGDTNALPADEAEVKPQDHEALEERRHYHESGGPVSYETQWKTIGEVVALLVLIWNTKLTHGARKNAKEAKDTAVASVVSQQQCEAVIQQEKMKSFELGASSAKEVVAKSVESNTEIFRRESRHNLEQMLAELLKSIRESDTHKGKGHTKD